MNSAILEALAGELGGANAQAQMMGVTRRSLLSNEPEEKDESKEIVKEAKIKAAMSLLSEAMNESGTDQ
jgi:hypothetical protein